MKRARKPNLFVPFACYESLFNYESLYYAKVLKPVHTMCVLPSLLPPHTFMFRNVQSPLVFSLKRVQLRDLKLLVITCFTPSYCCLLLSAFFGKACFSVYLPVPPFQNQWNESFSCHNMVVKITTTKLGKNSLLKTRENYFLYKRRSTPKLLGFQAVSCKLYSLCLFVQSFASVYDLLYFHGCLHES